MHRIHASAVAIEHQAVLLLGPSGAGKSDMALRLIDEGADFIADDVVILEKVRGQLTASPAPNGTGLMEVHGIGILRDIPYLKNIPVKLAFNLDSKAEIERLQSPDWFSYDEIQIQQFTINPFLCSASARIRMLIRHKLLPQDLAL